MNPCFSCLRLKYITSQWQQRELFVKSLNNSKGRLSVCFLPCMYIPCITMCMYIIISLSYMMDPQCLTRNWPNSTSYHGSVVKVRNHVRISDIYKKKNQKHLFYGMIGRCTCLIVKFHLSRTHFRGIIDQRWFVG